MKEEKLTVEAIHNEFDNASRVFQNMASEKIMDIDKALASKEDIKVKSRRVAALGFTKSKVVQKGKDLEGLETKKEHYNQLIAAICYFGARYPNYKFITQAAVEIICNKYGLVFGSSDGYIGDIPEKNIEEIEKFLMTIKAEDLVYENNNSGLLVAHETMLKRERSYTARGLMIVAPVKEFDTTGMKLLSYELRREPKVKDDPIVLMPVMYENKRYYLVVSKWGGEEANDPNVINESLN